LGLIFRAPMVTDDLNDRMMVDNELAGADKF